MIRWTEGDLFNTYYFLLTRHLWELGRTNYCCIVTVRSFTASHERELDPQHGVGQDQQPNYTLRMPGSSYLH
jgi:hypothetical protein